MTSRRSFCQRVAGAVIGAEAPMRGQERFALQNCPTEWAYTSAKQYHHPFEEEVDVVFTTPAGQQHRVPAFWAGGDTWRVRYAPLETGRYHFQTICSDPTNGDLHHRAGTLRVGPYTGENPLYRHGAVRVSRDRQHFEHADGTPFF